MPPTCAVSAESSSFSAFCSLEGAAGAEEAEAVESVLVPASANVPLSELVLCGVVSVKLGSSSAGVDEQLTSRSAGKSARISFMRNVGER